MRAKNAAPEGSLAADPRGSGFNSGSAVTLPHSIPQHIRDRLAAENVRTVQDWLALGPERFAIFGIPRQVALQIDELVREASP
jgi:hypothetical protein